MFRMMRRYDAENQVGQNQSRPPFGGPFVSAATALRDAAAPDRRQPGSGSHQALPGPAFCSQLHGPDQVSDGRAGFLYFEKNLRVLGSA
jgi:hypothetical protein